MPCGWTPPRARQDPCEVEFSHRSEEGSSSSDTESSSSADSVIECIKSGGDDTNSTMDFTQFGQWLADQQAQLLREVTDC